MRRRFLKVNGDSDSRVEDDNVGSEGQKKAGDGWERYIWRQYSNPRPESTRKEEVGKQRNSEPLELPSGPLTLGVGAQRNKTPRRSVCTLKVCMIDQQRSCSHERSGGRTI